MLLFEHRGECLTAFVLCVGRENGLLLVRQPVGEKKTKNKTTTNLTILYSESALFLPPPILGACGRLSCQYRHPSIPRGVHGAGAAAMMPMGRGAGGWPAWPRWAAWARLMKSPPPCCGCARTRPASSPAIRWWWTAAPPRPERKAELRPLPLEGEGWVGGAWALTGQAPSPAPPRRGGAGASGIRTENQAAVSHGSVLVPRVV